MFILLSTARLWAGFAGAMVDPDFPIRLDKCSLADFPHSGPRSYMLSMPMGCRNHWFDVHDSKQKDAPKSGKVMLIGLTVIYMISIGLAVFMVSYKLLSEKARSLRRYPAIR